MSETKHTPGPWTKGPYGDLYGSNGIPVQVYGTGMGSTTLPDETSKANAALVIAAPDLLEALKNLVEVLDGLFDDGPVRGIEEARAAIAKAEGGV